LEEQTSQQPKHQLGIDDEHPEAYPWIRLYLISEEDSEIEFLRQFLKSSKELIEFLDISLL
jgi:hypothetical protein